MANLVYEIKDGAYWMERSKKLEELLREAAAFCPAGHMHEIAQALKQVQ